MTFRHCTCPTCSGKGEQKCRSHFQIWAVLLCGVFVALTLDQWEADPWPRYVAIGVALLCLAVRLPMRCRTCHGAGKVFASDPDQVGA